MQYNNPFSSSFLNFLFEAWGGDGQVRARQNTQMEQSGPWISGNRQSDIIGSNPGVDNPTGWQGQDTSRAGNLSLSTRFSTGIQGGSAQTRTQQSVLDTPQAKAVSHWIVNDLKPGQEGKAVADVTQVLDVDNADGSTTRIGKNRDVLFDNKPVVRGPSSTEWTSTSFRLKVNSQTGISMSYNRDASNGNSTVYQSDISRDGDTWVQNTQGRRTTADGVSLIDGLGAYNGTQPVSSIRDPGLNRWINQQLQQGNSWLADPSFSVVGV